ncbi:MAG: tRNA (N(6)-L-threonylcarbamoyladenosine(37)-C(2))-methylthiotransferase MtaB [Thermoleophilia bacterium]
MPPVTTVAFRTLGCKLNQCETAQMEESLTARGLELVPWTRTADVRVLNTCTVTGRTDRSCRNEIGRVRRSDPASRLIVTGCYAQVAAETIAAIPGVDLVLGNVDKAGLAEHIHELLGSPKTSVSVPPTEPELENCRESAAPTVVTPYSAGATFAGDFVTHFSGYTRAFLKIQNGCDSRCSYCIIPVARGPSRSMPLADVLEQVNLLTERGYGEVVLTGIHLGRWGRDTGEGSLADLLESLLRETSALRFRLSSIEPLEVDERLLAVARGAGNRFAEHFHMPLQSGSPSVLRRMNRPYSVADYSSRVLAVREAFPDAAIGADVIVGFPGESNEEFAETLELVDRLPLTYLHVFPYSDRPGTEASRASGKVAPELIAERSARLRALGSAKDADFQGTFAGRELQALVLRQWSDDGRLVSLTGNYIEVLVDGDDDLINEFVLAVPRRREADGRWEGEVTAVHPRVGTPGTDGPRPGRHPTVRAQAQR